MKIESDKSIYWQTDRDPSIFKRSDVVWVRGGYSKARKIGLTQNAPAEVLRYYFHEVGHRIEDSSAIVLRPDDVKKTSIRLSPLDILDLMVFLDDSREKEKRLPRSIRELSNRIIGVFTKWTFDPTRIEFSHITPEQFTNALLSGHANLVSRDNSQSEPLYTIRTDSDTRNTEMVSVATELGCLYILENSINRSRFYRFLSRSQFELILPARQHVVYQRAQNLVARAYAGTGWKIP